MNRHHSHFPNISVMAVCCIIVLLLSTLCATVYCVDVMRARSKRQFVADTERTTELFVERMNNYDDLLYTGRSLLNRGHETTQQEWDTFFKERRSFERYKGVSSIIYAKRVTASQKDAFLKEMRTQNYFGGNTFDIKPAGDRDIYVVPTLVSSENDIRSLFGSDLYALPDRKATYDAAALSRQPATTGPLTLATGFQGFTTVLPVLRTGATDPEGYVVLSFRINDLLSTIFPTTERPYSLHISDVTPGNDAKPIFSSADWQSSFAYMHTSEFSVGSRTWSVTFGSPASRQDMFVHRGLPLLVLTTGLAITGITVAVFMWLRKRSATA